MASISTFAWCALAALLAVTTSSGATEMPTADLPAGTAVASLEPAVVPAAFEKADKFAYHVVRPRNPDGRTLVLLHGSGGNETSLVDLASRIAPRATLLGVRGRVLQEGRTRWYKRVTPTSFDQEDIRKESNAFVDFLSATAKTEKLDLSGAVFLGYSNGANLLAATTLLHPGLVRRAALLRAMSVLDEPPAASLTGTDLLVVAGKSDLTYAPFAPALEKLLTSCGATVDAQTIAADHMIGDLDADLIGRWLAKAGTTASAE